MAQANLTAIQQLFQFAEVLTALGLQEEATLAQAALSKLGATSILDTGVQQERNFIAECWALCGQLEGKTLSDTVEEEVALPNGLNAEGYKVSAILAALLHLLEEQLVEWQAKATTNISPQYYEQYQIMLSFLEQIALALKETLQTRIEGIKPTLTKVRHNIQEIEQHINNILVRAGNKDESVYNTLVDGKNVIDSMLKQYLDALPELQNIEEHRALQQHILSVLTQTLLRYNLDAPSEEVAEKHQEIGISTDLIPFPDAVVEVTRELQQIKEQELREQRNELYNRLKFSEVVEPLTAQYEDLVRKHHRVYSYYNRLEKYTAVILRPWQQMHADITQVAEAVEGSIGTRLGQIAAQTDLTADENFADLLSQYETLHSQASGEIRPEDALWILATRNSQTFRRKIPDLSRVKYFDRNILYSSENYYTPTFEHLSEEQLVPRFKEKSTAHIKSFCRSLVQFAQEADMSDEEIEGLVDEVLIEEETSPTFLQKDIQERLKKVEPSSKKLPPPGSEKRRNKIADPLKILQRYYSETDRGIGAIQTLAQSSVDLNAAVKTIKRDFTAHFTRFLHEVFGDEENYEAVLQEGLELKNFPISGGDDFISQLQQYLSAIHKFEGFIQASMKDYVLQRAWSRDTPSMQGVAGWRDRMIELLNRLFSSGQTFVETRYDKTQADINISALKRAFAKAYNLLKV